MSELRPLLAWVFVLAACASPSGAQKKEPELPEFAPAGRRTPAVQQLVDRAERELERNRPSRARQLLEKAIEKDSRRCRAHYLLGVALSLLNESQRARQSFERAWQLCPRDKKMALAAGMGYDLAANPARAIEIYTRALEHHPGDPDLLHQLGMSLLMEGRKKQALDALAVAYAGKPDSEIASDYGYTLLVSGRPGEAKRVLEGVWRSSPGRPDAGLNLARALVALKDFASAESVLDVLVGSASAPKQAWRLLALARLRQGKAGDALEAARRAAELEPDEPRSHFMLCMCLEAMGRHAEAADAARKALAVDSSFAPARKFLESLKRKGK
ncbi:MAG: hypothetical protein D6806_17550 [Deltaproteobacteria bacterium]|nr:MAG: hypothetical protein D6806_17550 [Deltaproteobacteria bacterium]